jgi:hypothetical protein
MTGSIRRFAAGPILVLTLIAVSACASPEPPSIGVAPQATDVPGAFPIQSTADAAALPAPVTASPAPPTPAFDARVCPLTGLPTSGIDWTQRRAILVVIGNSPPERPQSELALADIVFEHLTEGGITRFSAVYLCRDALNIGPVRSARLINLYNVPMMNAVFAFSGASDGALARVLSSELKQAMLYSDARDPGFRRVETRRPPFNLHTSTDAIGSAARERGWVSGARYTALPFGDAPSPGNSAVQIALPFGPGVSDVSYAYDPSAGAYVRSMGGFPHTDLSTGAPLSATNLLIVFAPHTETDIVEDSLGSRSIFIDLSAGGRAILLRDGQAFEGTWSLPDAHAFFELKDASGRPMLLKPGTTWIEVAPPDLGVVISEQ